MFGICLGHQIISHALEMCIRDRSTIQDGLPLNADIAADVAHALKQWALERGATHYTHWFQPLTGSTARCV